MMMVALSLMCQPINIRKRYKSGGGKRYKSVANVCGWESKLRCEFTKIKCQISRNCIAFGSN